MHEKAKQWDAERGFDTAYGSKNRKPYPPGFIPENRPCDWCGIPVKKGFIHPDCVKEEMKLYLDIAF